LHESDDAWDTETLREEVREIYEAMDKKEDGKSSGNE